MVALPWPKPHGSLLIAHHRTEATSNSRRCAVGCTWLRASVPAVPRRMAIRRVAKKQRQPNDKKLHNELKHQDKLSPKASRRADFHFNVRSFHKPLDPKLLPP